jgi:hypothetical protein
MLYLAPLTESVLGRVERTVSVTVADEWVVSLEALLLFWCIGFFGSMPATSSNAKTTMSVKPMRRRITVVRQGECIFLRFGIALS